MAERPKTRSTTLQSKLGFSDAELASEQHDAIVFWLDKNMDRILRSVIGFGNPTWSINWAAPQAKSQPYITRCRATLEEAIEQVGKQLTSDDSYEDARRKTQHMELRRALKIVAGWEPLAVPHSPQFVVRYKKWEYAVATRTGYTVGFVDLRAGYEKDDHLTPIFGAEDNPYQEREKWEPYAASWLADRVDRCAPCWHVDRSRGDVSFEVKSHIKSAGEVIRQIRLYQEHSGDHFVVVSPDTRFTDILREQGIGFVEYVEDAGFGPDGRERF